MYNGRLIATLLWLLVAVLSGLTISTHVDLPPRHVFFSVVAVVGLVLLVALNFNTRRTVSTNKLLPPGARPQLEKTTSGKSWQPAPPERVDASANNEPLKTSEERREWLDDFLVRQQQKK